MHQNLTAAGLLVIVLAGAALSSEGTKPKAAAKEYPVHGDADGLAIGAEYMVRSFSAPGRSLHIDNYLIVEVAVYPPDRRPLTVSSSQFTLRLNASKGVIYAQLPNFVAASLRYSDWEHKPQITAAAGPIIIGREPRVGRFPGDGRDQGGRMPQPTGTTNPETEKDEALVTELALREGPASGPVSGYLYFPYKGKTSKIQSLDLMYQPTPGSTPLSIRLR